ncbi:MAG: molybdopterin biosynthesis protein [SAR202 cluster bacterium]|nr:molybdopterin biosynthesis protein [SAR202 cluster bacterium]
MTQHQHTRRYYLSDIPLDEARQNFADALTAAGAMRLMPAETVSLDQARGRVTAEPVWAKVSSPHYDAAAMDGIAVLARDTVGATETSPVRLKLGEHAVWVDTGDPVPEGFDAVIMVEVVHEVDETTLEIQSAVAPYNHVRPLGEDIVATELLLPENYLLRPMDLGACAAAGIAELPVRRKPTVAVMPTGTELVQIGSPLKPGDIIEFNSLILGGMVDEWGGSSVTRQPVSDDYDRLKATIQEAVATSDIVVINAGSSAGLEDYTASLVEDLGELVVHGAAIRPGHPVILGVVDGTPVLGIPGYPVSAALTCDLFLKPLVEQMLGVRVPARERITATFTRKILSPMGEDEFVRVRLGRVGERLIATPIQRGAGVVTSLVRADGLVVVPRLSEGLDTGQGVTVDLLRPVEDVNGNIVAIGSHDLTLDLLASMLHRDNAVQSLSSANVGSLGGLVAVGRGEAHLAGTHLLDEDTGEYNLSYVRRYVQGVDVVVMNLVHRLQGLIVPKGNPKELSSLSDLAREDLAFVNRQRGSGTRMLLDFKLAEMGMTPEQVAGYDREEYTHLSVAAAVAGGRADFGLGILSAARAMDLDFVPLLSEQYDLVIPREHYDSDLLAPLLNLIRGDEFKSQVDALGGYDTSGTGTVVAEIRAGE